MKPFVYLLVFIIRDIINCPLMMRQQIPIVAALPKPERKVDLVSRYWIAFGFVVVMLCLQMVW